MEPPPSFLSAIKTEIWALSLVNSKGPGLESAIIHIVTGNLHLQAMVVIAAPAIAPESPKHVTVDRVGRASFVFAMTRGELPVAWYIQSSSAYFDFWYIEKDTVRTRVMLRSGDQTPEPSVSALARLQHV